MCASASVLVCVCARLCMHVLGFVGHARQMCVCCASLHVLIALAATVHGELAKCTCRCAGC